MAKMSDREIQNALRLHRGEPPEPEPEPLTPGVQKLAAFERDALRSLPSPFLGIDKGVHGTSVLAHEEPALITTSDEGLSAWASEYVTGSGAAKAEPHEGDMRMNDQDCIEVYRQGGWLVVGSVRDLANKP